ncbi:hypothetical protein SLS53_002391 [Cytospora paraplurivora]|uniref:Piwi domain-containing protein n=1 Tax=Cytospora paraplurivora TaxID=2898453 RepID=A0AAN9YKR9_9PEZI
MSLESGFASSLSLSNLNLTEQALPLRPGFGTQGKKAIVWANFVELMVDPKLVLHMYRIEVEPKAIDRKLTHILKLFFGGPDCARLRGKIATDFKSTMVSSIRLPEGNFNVRELSEGEDESDHRASAYHIHVRYTNQLPIATLLAYLDPSQPIEDFDKAATLQALNIVLNHYCRSTDSFITVDSKTFPLGTNERITDLGNGLQAIRGFYSSVRAATGRILVNVNVSYKAFFQPGPLDVLMKSLARANLRDYELERALKGLAIKVTHLSKTGKSGVEIPRIRTIAGFASITDGRGSQQRQPRVPVFGAGPTQVAFWLEDKHGYTTVYEFFRNKYGIKLKHADLPVVNVGSQDKPVYLPPEQCEVILGQNASRVKLDASQTTRMLGVAVNKPFVNAPTIVDIGLQAVGLAPHNELLSQFRIKANPSLITAAARILPEPRVLYSNKAARLNHSRAWNVMGQSLSVPATIQAWGWLVVDLPGQQTWCGFSGEPEVIKTLQAFHRVMNSMGIKIGPPNSGRRIQLDSLEDRHLDDMLAGAAGALGFLYIILPDKTPVYNRIKHLCDVKLGLINVCCIGRLFKRSDDQYFRNVALKINAKCGGHNQAVEPTRLHLIAQGETMVVGMDVTHPSPGSSGHAPSVAAMVASIDPKMGQYPSVCKIQHKSRQEMISELKDMLKSRLFLWKTKGKNASFPQNIVVYRDGVSEGQYHLVKEIELPQLRQACDELYSAANQSRPRITIVIVTKRHQRRFYPTAEAMADNGSNCGAGTVIDRGFTEARNWDFCIIPHTALKGTAIPAYYFVVHDEIFRTSHRGTTKLGPADTLEDLTQSLSYISARSTKPVSICAPADYADLACERARCYLSHLFDPSARSESGFTQRSSVVEHDRQRSQLQDEITLHKKTENVMVYI